jgi:SAM-dependent MidA family methyltransferase
VSWIIPEIEARGGAVPFEEYMELALYHPIHGYYSAERSRYGRTGDYLTAPTSSEWYPRVFARLLGRLAANGPVRWVDLASGDGSMIAGVAESLGSISEETLTTIVSLDRSAAMRRVQVDRFRDLGVEVEVRATLAGAAPSGPAILHASELFDALPVARVVGSGDGLTESWVAVDGGGLRWQDRSPRERVTAYFDRHGVVLEEGQVAEANLQAEATHRDLLRNAGTDSLVLVLDYGYESSRLYNPRGRRNGTLSTYRDHQVGRDPLDQPGETDLTAHVNWDDLRAAATAGGWTEIGLWPLAEFLVRAGIADVLEERGFGMEAELDATTVTVRQEVKRLLDPEGMGSDLKVLVQANGVMIDIAHRALSIE